MKKLKIGMVGLAYPTFNYQLGKELYEEAVKLLEKDYINYHIERELILGDNCEETANRLNKEKIELLIVINATFSYGGHIIKLVKELPGIPVIQWAFPEPTDKGNKLQLNSFCGANVNMSFLKRLGVKYKFIYGRPEEKALQRELESFIKAVWLRKQMNNTKLCLIGNRVPGFYLSNLNELLLRKEIGPELTHLSLSTLFKGAESQVGQEIEREMARMKEEVTAITTTDEMLEKTARIYLYLKKFKEEKSIDGFCIKCWPELQAEYNFSVCGVISRLNAENVVTSCEGDIPGLVTMLLLNKLTNRSIAFLDLVNADREVNVLEAWHCGGIAYNLAEDHCSTSYCEHPTIRRGIGVAVDFPIKSGPVTIAKLSEYKDEFRLFFIEGNAEKVHQNYAGNTVRVKLKTDVREVMNAVAYEGIEHHFALVHDHIGYILNTYACLCGFKTITI